MQAQRAVADRVDVCVLVIDFARRWRARFASNRRLWCLVDLQLTCSLKISSRVEALLAVVRVQEEWRRSFYRAGRYVHAG